MVGGVMMRETQSNMQAQLREGHVSEETQRQISTIHQLTTMLSTSEIVLFPGHSHLPTTGTDDPPL